MEWREVRDGYQCWSGEHFARVDHCEGAWRWVVSLDCDGGFCSDESVGRASSLEAAKVAVIEAIREYEDGE